MWIEIVTLDGKKLVNSSHLMFVNKSMRDPGVILFMRDKKELHLACDDDSHVSAVINGLVMALNGMDFVAGNLSIKPLQDGKSESLYKYMKLKELIGDRT
jgi:hypothetical protein